MELNKTHWAVLMIVTVVCAILALGALIQTARIETTCSGCVKAHYCSINAAYVFENGSVQNISNGSNEYAGVRI